MRVSNWPYLDDKERYIGTAEIRVLFYEWVERCETGKALDLLCKKKNWKEMFFLKSTLCCLTPLFWLFGFSIFYFFLPSQTGRLDLVWIDCKNSCALFFRLLVKCLSFSFPPSFVGISYFSQKFLDFFPKNLRFGICSSWILEPFNLPILLLLFLFLFIFEAFCSKFSFIKGEPAQFRFHSSEFGVSIMHSSLLS